MTTACLTTNQLSKSFKVHARVIEAALKAAGIKPAFEVPSSRGKMLLWPAPEATAAVEAHLSQRAEQAAQDEQAAASPTLGELEPVLALYVDDMKEHLTKTITKVYDQNVILMRAINTLTEKLAYATGVLNDLGTSCRNSDIALDEQFGLILQRLPLAPSVKAADPATPVPALVATTPIAKPELPKPKKRRIAIVGLLPSQQPLIEKEFKECFDLRYFSADDGRGKGFTTSVAHCDLVIGMANFIGHGAQNNAKAAGVKLEAIHGGISKLRDRLTNYFIEANG